MNKIITAGCVAVAAVAAVAMPNKGELADARRIVEDVTKADLAAFKAGKKPAKDVADAHISLAEKAENEAEKYLLYQGAFKLYTRSKEYDLAADTLQALQREIDDVPPKVIVEIVNREMRGITEKKAPRVFEILQQAKESSQSKSTSVASDDVLHDMKGPYGILVQPDPGCEKGAAYALQKLKDVYLPRAKKYYGDPFLGKRPSRVYTIDVKRNDSRGNSYRPGTGRWLIGLGEGCDKFEMSLDYLAASVLTICEDANWASFVFYVNKFVEGDAKKVNPVPRLKKDIERGLSKDGDDDDNWYRAHAPLWAALEELRKKHPNFIQKYCALKNRRFAEGKLPKKLSTLQMAALLGEATGENAVEIFVRYGLCTQEDAANERKKGRKNFRTECAAVTDAGKQNVLGEKSVADKLAKCDFLMNKNFKKNAKYYLCLFSASWCPPCRREMPRIAKIYADSIKAAPDVELIHFSCDKSDEKALAWAKEHDVGFPVVRARGGNALGLQTSGIPHLFILMADGTLVKEGHPKNLFSEEILHELKIGISVGTANQKTAKGEKTETVNGYSWVFCVKNGEATIVAETDGEYSCAVSPEPKGHLEIPSTLGGAKVRAIGRSAFKGCKELTSVTIPVGVRRIGYESFQDCSCLKSVIIPEGVTYIGNEAFANCRSLTSVTIPSSVSNIEILAFFCCYGLGEGVVIRDGWVLTVNGRCPSDYVIPEGTRGIASHGFRECEGLKTVTVPASVKHMGYWAFSYCRDLTSITMLGECPEKRINVFSPQQNIKSIHVPANAKSWAGMETWQGIPLVFDMK